MTTANHLINALAGEDRDGANTAFDAAIQERISDFLEVRKVELASTIMDDLQEATSAERQYVRQVAAVGGAYSPKRSIPRAELKAHAAKNLKKLGAETVKSHADTLKQLRQSLKAQGKLPGLRKEEAIVEGEHTAAHELVMYADNDSHLYKTSHQPIIANLKKKVKKGVYDHEKATKLWGYHADRAAQKYAKEHGDGTPWHKMFTPDDRKKAAKWFANGNKEELGLSESKDKYAWAEVPKADTTSIDAEMKKRAKVRKAMAKKTAEYEKKKADGTLYSETVEPGSAIPSNAKLNANVLANIRKAVSVLKLKGVNPMNAAAGHRDFGKLVAKNPHAPGYALLRKLAPGKAQAVQGLTQAGVPLGQSLEANPQEFGQVVQRIKRFK
jgi:hypothetical protein